ncbi:MAG TPA: di-heme oxidoredictase family protein [Vicinamibacterales bacterium]
MRTLLSVRMFVSASAMLFGIAVLAPTMWSASGPSEARAGFKVVSNGFAEEFCARQGSLTNSPNSPQIPDDECNFDAAAEEFTGPETVADGLGPVFNAAGCGECHMVPNLGGSSQIVEKRAGRFDGNAFFDHPGGSLIHDRATDPKYQEIVQQGHNVTAFRASLSVLGLGFVEAINSNTLEDIRQAQPASMRGRLIEVPVLESPGRTRAGRFGWKDQQASLVSFSADAYVNEMGITSPLQPDELTSNGKNVTEAPEAPPGVDDEGVDVELFALFMRSTLAPPRDTARANTSDARDGSGIFNSIGCNVCHTRDITTAPPGTTINGGALKVANALGNKVIHPFSDYLLHDIGTGDGIVQNGGGNTRNMLRTVPLWGLRARGRFMHDGLSLNVTDAILRHDNQARSARDEFKGLSERSKNKLLAFLMSL